MAFCGYMDPLNWSFRFYMCEAIDKLGFGQGWQPIIDYIHTLCSTLQNSTFNVTEHQCHLFYLQILAEFGDFRHFSDPLAPPSDEIKEKIIKMRRSELRHELILTNTQIRYNNYILKHHSAQPIKPEKMNWIRFQSQQEEFQESGVLAKILLRARTAEWFRNLPTNGKGPNGLKEMTIDVIFSRCLSGIVSTPMEVVRDVFHLIVNLSMAVLSEKEKVALTMMKNYFLEELRPLLEGDPLWAKVGPFVEGIANGDQ
jgi:hypothetical protein